MAQNRLFHLDFARSVAIIMVTSFHLWRFVGSPTYFVGPFDLYGILAHGYLGVDLFFVVSGYAMKMTWEKTEGSFSERYVKFLKARALRLYPSYVVALILWVIVIRLTGIANKPTGLRDIISHLFFFHTLMPSTYFSISGVMWSLGVEVHFYLLFPLIVRSGRVGFFGCLTAGIAAAAVAAFWFTGDNPVIRWNAMTFLPLFLAGVWLRGQREKPWMTRTWLFWATLLLIGLIATTTKADEGINTLVRILIGGCLGITLVGLTPFREGNGVLGSIFSVVGKASYSIYLYNYVFLALTPARVHGMAGILLYAAPVFTTGICAWLLIEKPFEILRHRGFRRKSLVSIS